MRTSTIQLFEDRPNVKLTTYLYDPDLEMIGKVKRPAVIICGGGAYFSCSDAEGEPVAMNFLAMGYNAFTLKYSTYGVDAFINHFENMERRPQSEYPTQVRELARAVLTVKEHAEEWNVDENKIIICGFSAGAHNTAMMATMWDNPIVTEYYNRPAEDFKVAAAILCYPLTDYVYMKEFCKNNLEADIFFRASNKAFVGIEAPSDGLLREISPALNVTKNTPPMFIWTTAADQMVPTQHSLRMAHALSDCNIPYELHIFEEGQHGLSLGTQASAGGKNQIDRNVPN